MILFHLLMEVRNESIIFILMYVVMVFANSDIPKNFYYKDSLKIENLDTLASKVFTNTIGAENYYPYFSGMFGL